MKKYVVAALLGTGAIGAIGAGVLTTAPASAQISVFDPTNYTQNLLTAARTLQQINNQIQSLQNEAQMLAGQAKNLSRIDFPQLDQLRQKLGEIDKLMGQAQGIDFRVDQLGEQFRQQFPDSYVSAMKHDQRLAVAKQRLDNEMAAFRQTMTVQSGIVENVRDDAQALAAIVAKSQGAEGSLQVSQATNQLLALATKQQFQLQNLMAAQFRSQSLEAARRGQSEREARERTSRFLGDGKAYTPRQ
ncbi:Conjugal transfer protein TrbJ [uncultured Sphingopyxis sp.]|uniref:Conjugal transfer protein TrbJ n=1 Tax=uncultured Sphingopyxis sp. TaxID=310581 RepID=A0A1Y5PPI3_9SPHN|nr:P-type conjugative transfer protein TrbJ [uncultured Sphingopyxis sp.]SBV31880.1 Conjugal transfer protein TrbJ [uncultured Sphingopyxis sp.]